MLLIDRDFNPVDPHPFMDVEDPRHLLPPHIETCPIITAIGRTTDVASLAIGFTRNGKVFRQIEFPDCLRIYQLPRWTIEGEVLMQTLSQVPHGRYFPTLLEYIVSRTGRLEIQYDGDDAEIALELPQQPLMLRVPRHELPFLKQAQRHAADAAL